MKATTANYKVMRCKNLNSESLSSYYFSTLIEAEKEMRYAESICLGAYIYKKVNGRWIRICD